MAKEIERKFLVKSNDYKLLAQPVFYKQAYLSLDPQRVVRIRIAGEKAFLTIKGKNKGLTRVEFEFEIPTEEASEILSTMVLATVIEKNRYVINYKGNTWEVDEFLGENEGLIIAEIELGVEDANFEKPYWIGNEVSADSRYYNSNLSQNPYKNWK